MLFKVDGLAVRFPDWVGRAGLDAQSAAGALVGDDLQGVAGLRQTGGIEFCGLEGFRGALELRLRVVLGANDAVRADEGAVAALDAGVGLPGGDDVR